MPEASIMESSPIFNLEGFRKPTDEIISDISNLIREPNINGLDLIKNTRALVDRGEVTPEVEDFFSFIRGIYSHRVDIADAVIEPLMSNILNHAIKGDVLSLKKDLTVLDLLGLPNTPEVSRLLQYLDQKFILPAQSEPVTKTGRGVNKHKFKKSWQKNIAQVAVGLAGIGLVANAGIPIVGNAILEAGRKTRVKGPQAPLIISAMGSPRIPPLQLDIEASSLDSSSKALTIISETQPKNTPIPIETLQELPTATPTPSSGIESKPPVNIIPTEIPKEPEKEPEVEIGNKNIIEFLLNPTIDKLIHRAEKRAKNDPAYAERVTPENLKSRNITTVLLGLDSTRQRPNEFEREGVNGWARADSIMILSVNPQTGKTLRISINRDLLIPDEMEMKFFEGPRINQVPFAEYINQGKINSRDFLEKIITSLTGLRVDGIFAYNIDSVQGSDFYEDENGERIPGHLGLIDQLFPDGLKINAEQVDNDQFPTDAYGTTEIHISAGEQNLKGEKLAQYGRSRTDNNDSRNKRQRQVASAAMSEFRSKVFWDLAKGNSETLDKLIDALKDQKQERNIFGDVDFFIQLLQNCNETILDLRLHHPEALVALAANTKQIFEEAKADPTIFLQEYSLEMVNRQNTEPKAHVQALNLPKENGVWSSNILKIAGTDLSPNSGDLKPTPFGNFLNYYRAVRNDISQKAAELSH